MMHSAVFGQIIIMIVFIPILSLANVEGKMFRPMALVFCFALAGALLLCFTYVPVMASLLLKPQMPTLRLSSRLIGWAERRYVPALRWGLRRPAAVIGLAAAGMAGALLLFSRMGGEFVPTLDEGDFVIQPVLKTGTSLEKTVEITTQIEQILLQFPEVAQVVSRIGAAEVPTDPMSMEESDVIIRLRPKGEWTSAATKDELADRFKEALSAIPGIGYEFTQPIEMRFNELITGVRADLAIKIFGEDLDVLSRKALEVEQAIQGIEGAADISVEKVAGLPQVSVAYRRDRLAQYGVSVEALNQILSAGFSGLSAGAIFEGERQFNVALRFEEGHRQRLDDIANTSVRLPSGGMVPFRELADIAYTQGPAKISRDNTRRRIVVGVNVRNRDLESVVKDAQAAIAQQVSLPSGYRIDYGGQFENLREARQRLMVAVPVALLLIFALLYFAFGNVRDALMIYSAIPLSAIGGVLLLFARGMPFSISAGVGFIALFGIAVLNGIVMIEHFREMEHHGHTWLAKRIMLGARQRLRPVLLTASAAALGFLPMAVSSSAGAEVQRPLATVVVGGLATATFLTLLVLPVLYSLFGRKGNRLRPSGTVAVLALLWLAVPAQAQQPATTREAAVAQALAQSPALQASALQAQAQRQLAGIRRDWAPSQFYYHFDQNNIAPNGFALRVLGLNHTLQLPAVQRTRQEVHRAQAELYGLQGGLDSLSVALAVSNAYAEAQYWEAMSQQLAHADSLLQEAVAVAQRRYQTGEAEALAWQALRAQAAETGMLLEQARMQAALARGQLQRWMPADTLLAIEPMAPWQLPEAAQAQQAAYQEAQAAVAQRQADAVRASGLPSFDLSAFGGSNALGAPWYWGIQVGVSLPLTQGAQRKQVAAAQTAAEGLRQEASAQAQDWARRLAYWQAERNRCAAGLAYYAQEGREMAHRLRQHASLRMAQGEIDFLAFVQLERQAQGMEQAHLEQLYRYNLAMAALCYLP
jgi:cobalt-zinc-cadmium resistance protein CzcA